MLYKLSQFLLIKHTVKSSGIAHSRMRLKFGVFMPKVDQEKILTFKSAQDFGLWLKENHTKESELWVKIFKIKTGILSVTWDDVVIESLCWGWIDGVKKSLDDQAYLQRVTPRTARSNWSKRNREHVERLIVENRMME